MTNTERFYKAALNFQNDRAATVTAYENKMQELENLYGVRFTRSRGSDGRQIRLEAVDDMYDNDDVSDIE